MIAHYRADGKDLPESTRGDINARWMSRLLEVDQSRHPVPLDRPRELRDRVQGCCRDHTLFCVATLRQHGIPARSRVGFAGYFTDGWHHDHVVVEAWLDGRWRRFDPEMGDSVDGLPTPMDMPPAIVASRGFVTAAQAWTAYRRGEIDPDTYGVDPSVPDIRGPRFLYDEVVYEVAHRFGDELLLWDVWGRMLAPDEGFTDQEAAEVDEIAAQLLARYRSDPGLHPGAVILQADPLGGPPQHVTL